MASPAPTQQAWSPQLAPAASGPALAALSHLLQHCVSTLFFRFLPEHGPHGPSTPSPLAPYCRHFLPVLLNLMLEAGLWPPSSFPLGRASHPWPWLPSPRCTGQEVGQTTAAKDSHKPIRQSLLVQPKTGLHRPHIIIFRSQAASHFRL